MHPLIVQFFKIADNQFNLHWYCDRHGLKYNTIKSWKRKTKRVTPTLTSFDEALSPLGYELQIVLKKKLYEE